MIKLGDKVKDHITGFTGIVVARTEWLNKCVRLMIQPQELKDGAPIKSETFDIEDCVLIEADALRPKEAITGGPMPRANKPCEDYRQWNANPGLCANCAWPKKNHATRERQALLRACEHLNVGEITQAHTIIRKALAFEDSEL